MSSTCERSVVLLSLCCFWCTFLGIVAQEDEGGCISGFGEVTNPATYIEPSQVLIPSLQFNDSGHITVFHLAGICSGSTGSNVSCINILQVWRPSGGDSFSIAANFTATLTVPFATPATASVTVDEPIPFSSGDVLGFTPGPNTGFFFQIASTRTTGNTHTYHTYDSFATELSTAGSNRVRASPIISVEVTCRPVTTVGLMAAGVAVGVVVAIVVVVVLVVLLLAAAITWQVRRSHLHGSHLHLKTQEVTRTYDTVASTRSESTAYHAYGYETPVSPGHGGANNSSTATYAELDGRRDRPSPEHLYHSIDSVQPMAGASTHQLRAQAQRSMPIYGVVPSEEERRKMEQENRTYWQGLPDYEYPADKLPENIESLYEMASTEVDTYWEPHSTEDDIYSQMSQHKYQEIQPSGVTMSSQLGAGQFGEVYKGELQTPYGPVDVAVKLVKKGAPQEERVKLLQEAAILGQFKHRHIVRLIGVVTLGKQRMMLMELLPGGDLRDHLLDLRQRITTTTDPALPTTLLKFGRQVAEGLSYLAGKSFVHRDIAARNILLDQEHNCKISDFGMSRGLNEEMYYVTKGGQVPLKWTAPEAVLYKKYSTSSDVWSYGMLMYEIWSLGHKPFGDMSPQDIVNTAFQTGYCQPPPPGCPRAVYAIMVDCWNPQRTLRPEASALHCTLTQTSEGSLLAWTKEDMEASPRAAELGAPLEEGTALYQDLQTVYRN